MAINNYIKDMQNKIKKKDQLVETIRSLQDAKTKAKSMFIYKSICNYLENEETTLEEAQQFAKDNMDSIKIQVESNNTLISDERWTLIIFDKTYTTTFKIKDKKDKEDE